MNIKTIKVGNDEFEIRRSDKELFSIKNTEFNHGPFKILLRNLRFSDYYINDEREGESVTATLPPTKNNSPK